MAGKAIAAASFVCTIDNTADGMRLAGQIIGNIIWLVCGGLSSAIGYFTGSIALMITIVGIPFAFQTMKLGLLCLWPFGSKVIKTGYPSGCLAIMLNIVWTIFGGLHSWFAHIIFGTLLFITIIGIPFGKQHFKMAGLIWAPFGKDVELHIGKFYKL